MDKAREIAKWYVSLIVCIVFFLNAAVYFNAIEGLVKPAGIGEAFDFLISSPSEYFICLFCGSVAKIAVLVMLIVAIASVVCFIDTVLNGSTYYDPELRKKDLILGIVNVILLIVMTIVQREIIVDFWILVGLLVLLAFMGYALFCKK